MSFLNFLSSLSGGSRTPGLPRPGASFLDFARDPMGALGRRADAMRTRVDDTLGRLRDPFGVAARQEQAQARDLVLDQAELADLAADDGGVRPPADRPGGFATDWGFLKPVSATFPSEDEVEATLRPKRPDSFLSYGGAGRQRAAEAAAAMRRQWAEDQADLDEHQRRFKSEADALADITEAASQDNPFAVWRRRRQERRRQEDLEQREREAARILAAGRMLGLR